METLTYELVRQAGFGLASGSKHSAELLAPCRTVSLGPLLELSLLLKSHDVPIDQLRGLLGRTRTLDAALQATIHGSHFWHDDRRGVGVISCDGSPSSDPTLSASGVHDASEAYLEKWSLFAHRLEASSERCGLSRNVAVGFAGVVQELQDNVFEHSCKPNSGVVGFRHEAGTIEIVVSDCGVA